LNAIAPQIRHELREIDSSILVRIESLNQRVDESLVTERVFAALSAFLGVVGLCLAVAGLYGLLGYTVAQRTGEIGIRLALGAHRSDVLWMIMKQALILSSTGLVLGSSAAIAMGRFADKLVYGVTAKDPAVLGTAVVLVLVLVFVAAYLPARRAMRVDPMTALRHE